MRLFAAVLDRLFNFGLCRMVVEPPTGIPAIFSSANAMRFASSNCGRIREDDRLQAPNVFGREATNEAAYRSSNKGWSDIVFVVLNYLNHLSSRRV